MNQMEIFKNPELAASGSLMRTASTYSAAWMLLLRWDTVIPATRLLAIVGAS